MSRFLLASQSSVVEWRHCKAVANMGRKLPKFTKKCTGFSTRIGAPIRATLVSTCYILVSFETQTVQAPIYGHRATTASTTNKNEHKREMSWLRPAAAYST